LALLSAASPGYAALGEAGGLSLLQPPAARPAALGEAYVAATGGAEMLGYNPAGLSGLAGLEAGALYYGGFAGDKYLSALIARPVLGAGAGIRFAYYDSGSVVRQDLITGELSEVSAQRDFLMQGGIGYHVPRTDVMLGFSAKIFHTILIEEISASQVAADAGMRLDLPRLNLSLGLAAQHIGPRMLLEKDCADLPFLIRAGLAYRVAFPRYNLLGALTGRPRPQTVFGGADPAHELLFLLDVPARFSEEAVELAAGLEYSYGDRLALRGGYRTILQGAAWESRIYTAGAGVSVMSLRIDYAMEILSFSVLHRIGLTYAPGPRI
jgi:hypothetical protein